MKTLMSAIVMTATIAGAGAAFAQAGTTTPGNSGVRDRDALMKQRGMQVRVYDRAGTVYYDGEARRFTRNDGMTGVWFPKFSNPAAEEFVEGPDSSGRSEAK